MTHRRLPALLVAVILLTAACSGDDGPADTTGTTAASGAAEPERATVVFEGGEDDIDTFRIPSVVTTADDEVVVAAEARPLSPLDLDPRHLVARTSDDGGQSWGPITEVGRQSGCNQHDPVLVAPDDGDLLILFKDCELISISRSDDGGRSWSEPEQLVIDETDALPAGAVDSLRPGPGHGIELSAGTEPGRLVVAADQTVDDTSHLVLLLSDDGGATWRVGAATASPDDEGPNPDETALTELTDGTILVSSRNGSTSDPGRIQLRSDDSGESFADGGALTVAPELTVPVVEGALVTATDADRAVFSSPSDPLYRRGVRLWSSVDGEAWAEGPLVTEAPGAYTDMTVLPGDGHEVIGVVVETGDRNPYQRIDLVRVPSAELDEPAPPLDPEFDVSDAVTGRMLVDGERFEVVSWCFGAPRVELGGGWIEPDLSATDGVGFTAHVDDGGDGPPLDLDGTLPIDLDAGITMRGSVDDADGAPHDVDVVIVNFEPCP